MSLMVFFTAMVYTILVFSLYSKWLLSVLVKKRRDGRICSSTAYYLKSAMVGGLWLVFFHLFPQATPNEWLSVPSFSCLSFIKITGGNRVKSKTQINHGTCTFKISQRLYPSH